MAIPFTSGPPTILYSPSTKAADSSASGVRLAQPSRCLVLVDIPVEDSWDLIQQLPAIADLDFTAVAVHTPPSLKMLRNQQRELRDLISKVQQHGMQAILIVEGQVGEVPCEVKNRLSFCQDTLWGDGVCLTATPDLVARCHRALAELRGKVPAERVLIRLRDSESTDRNTSDGAIPPLGEVFTYMTELQLGVGAAGDVGRDGPAYMRFAMTLNLLSPFVPCVTLDRSAFDRFRTNRRVVAYWRRLMDLRAAILPNSNNCRYSLVNHSQVFTLSYDNPLGEVMIIFRSDDHDGQAMVRMSEGTWKRILDSSEELWSGPGSIASEVVCSEGSVDIPLRARAACAYWKTPEMPPQPYS